MIILPAIDIKDGKCVRLTKGDFDTVEQVAEDPVKTGLQFKADGAKWIHMVDLDGALEGRRVNAACFTQVAEATGLDVELGGGIRDMETVEYYLNNGIRRVILGSAALHDPEFAKEALDAFGDRIAVGIDAKDGMVRVSGWVDESQVHFIDLARQMVKAGAQTIIFTDISKDGTLSGPNLEQLAQLQQAVDCNIIASGGIHTIADIRALKTMALYGAICGKSIYKGTLSLMEAIAVAEGE